jgi:pyruvate dehydrogenase E1 component
VILAKTVKGWTLGTSFEGRMATHQMKKLKRDDLMLFRDRLQLPISDADLQETAPYYHPGPTPRRSATCRSAGASSGGYVPERRGGARSRCAAGGEGVRRAAARLGQAGRRHDDGGRPAAQGPHEGQGDRAPVRPIIPDEAA